MSKYYTKKILIKGYTRKKPNQKYVKPYYRNQRFATNPVHKPPKTKRMLSVQRKEGDWSHQSVKYPNIVGLSDKQIEDFINDPIHTESERKILREYVKYIRAYTPEDIREISKELYSDFDSEMKEWNSKHPEAIDKRNDYKPNRTIFVTSPKGGFEVLSQFAYANYKEIKKRNIPYDLMPDTAYGKKVMSSESLPYGENQGDNIRDVNDIVFIDDIYMSGEQSRKAVIELKKRASKLDVAEEQKPRLHYIAIAGNSKYKTSISDKQDWTERGGTFRVGRDFEFHFTDTSILPHKRASAIVFPFSIPDGMRHRYARLLYKKYDKFPHRGV